MSPRITPQQEKDRLKNKLFNQIVKLDNRLFFKLPRDAEGNIIPLPPEKQQKIAELEAKIRKLNSVEKLTPAMRKW
ncbi:MAG: hypothetical protein ACFE8J_08710 [Candidatus Heimdallarchaeota archaeon]